MWGRYYVSLNVFPRTGTMGSHRRPDRRKEVRQTEVFNILSGVNFAVQRFVARGTNPGTAFPVDVFGELKPAVMADA